MPWIAIKYVTTVIGLLALLLLVILEIVRRFYLTRESLIKSAPNAERARLIEKTLIELFVPNIDDLSQERRYEIVMQQIRERARRYRLNMMVVLILGLAAAAVAVTIYLVGPGKKITDGGIPRELEHRSAILFQTTEAARNLPNWNPVPDKTNDGAMRVGGGGQTVWNGPAFGHVSTLEFWSELNRDQQKVSWGTTGETKRNQLAVLQLPPHAAAGQDKLATYDLQTPGVDLQLSHFAFDRPIEDEILTVLMEEKLEGDHCEVGYTFALDGPPARPNEIPGPRHSDEDDIWRDLFGDPDKLPGCITLRGTAPRAFCEKSASVVFSAPDGTGLRLIKAGVNEDQPIGRRCNSRKE